jgi:rhamnulokinase
MTAMAAVDLGAQSGRVAVGRFDGERIAVEEVHRFENLPLSINGSLRWDLHRLYEETLIGLRAAARSADVRSLAVDSWAVDFGLLDRQGRLLQQPRHYRDARRADATATIYARIPPRELYERTGIQLIPINSLFELAAMAADGDPALREAETLLLIPDLFHHRLCGSRTTEFTNATTTQCFDPRAHTWANDLLERLDIPTRILPDVVEPGTPLGRLDDEVAAETGLRDATVVAAATHDTGSAVAAVPFRRADAAFLSVGTWSLVGFETAEPLITDATFSANVTNEGGIGRTYRLLRNVTGLWLLDECRRSWAADGRVYSFSQLADLSRSAPAFRSLVDPDDPAFVTPGDMPARIARYCARTGQPEPRDPADIGRCILESIALKHAHAVEAVSGATELEPAELHVVGGGAKNELLCDWTAQAAGLPVLAGPQEATLLGNLLVQAMALGEIGSPQEIREVVKRSVTLDVYEPRESSGWAEARERLSRLVGDEEMQEVNS